MPRTKKAKPEITIEDNYASGETDALRAKGEEAAVAEFLGEVAEMKAPKVKHVKPDWEPFEVLTTAEGKVSTWKHLSGEFEQWKDNERVYGP
jgi:hypothetical protein